MLEVRSPGLLTTVQDGIGRPDAAPDGVPRCGAADPWGLAVANVVVGNAPIDAAIEVTLLGLELVVVEACLIGLGGADLGATVVETGRRLRPGSAHRLEAGWSVAFGERDEASGVRAYLALPGGVDVPPILGSASTCLAGRFGGLKGRPLRAGDWIAGRDPGREIRGVWAGRVRRADYIGTVRVAATRGPHAIGDSLRDFLGQEWEVEPASDRMGVRLAGRAIESGGRGDLVSFPTRWGAIQLPSSGQPIVLLVDAPTVGGYPVIAVVASADRSIVGQLGPGGRVRFELVSEAEAQAAARALASELEDAVARTRADEAWHRMADEAGAWPG